MSLVGRPRSVRARLTLTATVGAAVVLSVGAGLMYLVLTSQLDQALSDELAVRAGDVEAEVSVGAVVSLGGPLPTQILDVPSGTVLFPGGEEPLLSSEDAAAAFRSGGDAEFEESGQRLLARVVVDAGGVDRLVVVAGSTASIIQARNQLLAGLVVAGPVAVGGVTATAWMLTGAALSPVRSMTRRAASISVADPAERLPESDSGDEIAELAATLNGMLDRITASVQHERAFIDDASHELRTPVAVLRGELELLGTALRRSGADQAVQTGIASALEETDRITRLAEQLLVLARIDAGELAEVGDAVLLDVGTAVDQILARMVVPSSLTVEVEVDWAAVPALDADSFDRLLTNLMSNSARFASSTIEVKLWRRDGGVTMTVADDGPGFPERVLERPFDRFVRADPARAGTGLGLAIVGSTARAARGDVALGNGGALGGAWVRVTLPAAADDAGSH